MAISVSSEDVDDDDDVSCLQCSTGLAGSRHV
jgi:hypothetical protein